MKILKMFWFILVVFYFCIDVTFADYPYIGSCPTSGVYVPDMWGFYKCECTSYAAYKLNEQGIKFNNSFMQQIWSSATNWGVKANGIGIGVDNKPVPGDIVWWNANTMPKYGHVAYVEKVEYGSDMRWAKVYISQYNGSNEHEYSEEWITPANNPTGFIHFKSYKYPGLICADHEKGKKLCWKAENNDPDCANSDLIFFNNEADGVCSLPVSASECSGIVSLNFPNIGGMGGFNLADSEDSESDPGQTSGDYGKVTLSSPSGSSSRPELYVKELKFK